MTVCLFAGPSLPPAIARQHCDAVLLPPVRQGDVLACVQRHRPQVIAIVDGYFREVAAVWHKEILWAMSEGITVLGAASMGALRAAELATFGMVGFGEVYRAYRRGVLLPYVTPFIDDDEVAVIHGPAETDYLVASEAMVNIRFSLAAAARDGIISSRLREQLVGLAKAMPYRERRYETLWQRGLAVGISAAAIARLQSWLPEGRIDQKRRDALALVASLDGYRTRPPPPSLFRFLSTGFWEHTRRQGEQASAPDPGVWEELCLEEDTLAQLRREALLRLAAARLADRPPLPWQEAVTAMVASTRGISDPATLDAWCCAQGITADDWQRMVANEARLIHWEGELGPALDPWVWDCLRLSGDHHRFAERAKHKAQLLRGVTAPPLAGPVALDLAFWYFESYRQRSPPADIVGHAQSLGFASLEDFAAALWREHRFLHHRPAAEE